MGDMVEQIYIPASAAQTLWPKMLFLYSREEPPQPLEMVEGTFGHDRTGE